MTFMFICQVVDEQDPIQGTTIKWIEAFARHPHVEHVIVLALRTGLFSFPENVTVYGIQQRNRVLTLLAFYKTVFEGMMQHRVNFFFIYQGGAYPFLLLPWKVLAGKAIYQWKAHPYISLQMRLYAKCCDTKIFTSTPQAFPMNSPKVKIVGQGVDIEKFCPQHIPKSGDLVAVGRVSPVKRLDEMFRVLALCRREYGASYRLDIYGPVAEKDSEYGGYMEQLLDELDLAEYVSFKGAIRQDRLPELLNAYRACMNFSKTALDRSAVEAMACGVPVISTNACVADILPQKLQHLLIIPEQAARRQAAKFLHGFLSQSDERLAEIGKDLRDLVVREHSIHGLIERILTEIEGR